MRNVFMAAGLMSVVACVEPPETESSTNVASIAVDLIFAGDPDDGGTSVVHQEGQVHYQISTPGGSVMKTLPPDLSVEIPLRTATDQKYLASRLTGIADLLQGLGYSVELVCMGSVCAVPSLELPPDHPPGDGIGPK